MLGAVAFTALSSAAGSWFDREVVEQIKGDLYTERKERNQTLMRGEKEPEHQAVKQEQNWDQWEEVRRWAQHRYRDVFCVVPGNKGSSGWCWL